MKPFTKIAAGLFALIALAHLYRVIVGLSVTVGGHDVPQWVSVIGMVITGSLALALHRESGRAI